MKEESPRAHLDAFCAGAEKYMGVDMTGGWLVHRPLYTEVYGWCL